MPIKKTIQDIKVPERAPARTPVEPVVPQRKKPSLRTRTAVVSPSNTVPTVKKYPRTRPRVRVLAGTPSVGRMPSSETPRQTPTKKRYWWVVGTLGFFVVAAMVVGSFIHTATIVIAPQEVTGTQSTALVTLAAEPRATEIPLIIMTLNDTITETVRSAGSVEVAERASGTITVYNNFSTTPQRLVEETRFEAANGKIYTTAKGSVTVIPGKTGDTPGSVEVTVYAAEPGAEYNQPLTDFVIPGFKGTPKFDGFYARSTTPLAGGFVGGRATISSEDEARIVAGLSQKLGDRLRAEAFLQKTDEFIILEQSSRVEIGEPQIVASTENMIEAKITIPGSYSAVLVSKDELARRLAAIMIPGYQGEPIAIQNMDALQLAVETVGPIATTERLSVSITGTPEFVYGIDESLLKKQLLALTRKEAQAVFARYPAIESARLVLRPFWKFRLPATDNDLRIRYDLDGK